MTKRPSEAHVCMQIMQVPLSCWQPGHQCIRSTWMTRSKSSSNSGRQTRNPSVASFTIHTATSKCRMRKAYAYSGIQHEIINLWLGELVLSILLLVQKSSTKEKQAFFWIYAQNKSAVHEAVLIVEHVRRDKGTKLSHSVGGLSLCFSHGSGSDSFRMVAARDSLYVEVMTSRPHVRSIVAIITSTFPMTYLRKVAPQKMTFWYTEKVYQPSITKVRCSFFFATWSDMRLLSV